MFNPFPVEYIESVFRPTSEGRSLISQITNGCSWNRCTYCDRYTAPQKKFRPRPEQDVLAEIKHCGEMGGYPRRVFLADGDAKVLSMRRLPTILESIKTNLPDVTRVSSYCLPSHLKNKSVEDLPELEELGLKLIDVGAKSGDDTVLKYIDKGETCRGTANVLIKAHEAGMKSPVMILNGIGGSTYSKQHALASARQFNETPAHYAATLILTFYQRPEKVTGGFKGDFQEFNTLEFREEMRMLIGETELNSTICRSDQVPNQLVLKGVLGKDKPMLLSRIDEAIEYDSQHPELERGSVGY